MFKKILNSWVFFFIEGKVEYLLFYFYINNCWKFVFVSSKIKMFFNKYLLIVSFGGGNWWFFIGGFLFLDVKKRFIEVLFIWM